MWQWESCGLNAIWQLNCKHKSFSLSQRGGSKLKPMFCLQCADRCPWHPLHTQLTCSILTVSTLDKEQVGWKCGGTAYGSMISVLWASRCCSVVEESCEHNNELKRELEGEAAKWACRRSKPSSATHGAFSFSTGLWAEEWCRGKSYFALWSCPPAPQRRRFCPYKHQLSETAGRC